MVTLDIKYNLNHIYRMNMGNDEIAIGSQSQTKYFYLKMFEKSLALTSDLKRLPILRGLAGSWMAQPWWINYMNASGLSAITVAINFYTAGDEDQVPDIDDRVATYRMQMNQVVATNSMSLVKESFSWDYEGGVLLGDTIVLEMQIQCVANVAGAAFPKDTIKVDLYLEVDWVPISKGQFDEYLKEHIYAKM